MNKYLTVAALAAGCVNAQTFLLRSTDGGRTWKDIDPGPPHLELLDLQISSDGSRLYALTVTRTEASQFDMRRDFAVLTSPDRGTSWQVLDALGVSNGFAAIAVAPSDANTVYLSRGEASGGFDGATITLVRTTDAGATSRESKEIAAALRPYNTYPAWCGSEPAFFGVHPANPANLFMTFNCSGDSIDPFHAFAGSGDGGVAWRASSSLAWLNYRAGGSSQRPDPGVVALFANASQPELVYSRNVDDGGRFNLARSSDGGESWSPLLRDIALAAVDPRDVGVLLAGKEDGTLWRSADRGESWDQLGAWLPLERLFMHPARESLVLGQAAALIHQPLGAGEILRSEDRGSTWSVMPTGLDGFSFVFDPRDPDIVYGKARKRLEPRLRPPFVRNLAGGSVLSPGSLFSVYGEDLSGSLSFGGQPAEILFVSRRQVNGRVPDGLNPGRVTVEVLVGRTGETAIDRQEIVLEKSAPVILPDWPLLHADGLRPITEADPARPGERILIYATGVGPSPFVQIWPTYRPLEVKSALSATALPDRPGVSEVAIEVPGQLDEGSYVLLFWGGRNSVRLSVRR